MVVNDVGEREPRPSSQFEYVLHIVTRFTRAVYHLFRDVFERGRAEPEVVGRRGHEEQDGKRVPAARTGWVEGGHVVDIPAQGDLPVVEVLEGGVAQQLERHPVGLRARVVDEGCDSPGLESECKLMGWNPNKN